MGQAAMCFEMNVEVSQAIASRRWYASSKFVQYNLHVGTTCTPLMNACGKSVVPEVGGEKKEMSNLKTSWVKSQNEIHDSHQPDAMTVMNCMTVIDFLNEIYDSHELHDCHRFFGWNI
jgi:hypothetical protein